MTDIRLQNIRVENPASPLIISKGKVLFENTSPSLSASESAVIIRGGLSINSTEDSISLLNGGALTIAGGLSVSKKLFIGDEVNLDNEYASLRIHGIVKERLKIDTVTNKRITMAPDGMTDVFQLTEKQLVLYHTQPSINFTEGSLILNGGITVVSTNGNSLMTMSDIVSNKNVTVKENVSIRNNNIIHNYPLYIGGNTNGESIFSQGRVVIENNMDPSNYDGNASINIMGGATVSKKIYIGDSCIIKNLLENENTYIRGTTDSTSITSGSLVVNGGVGIKNNLYVGNDLVIDTNTLVVKSATNRVGINTNSPNYELDVFGAIRSGNLLIKNTDVAVSLSNGGSVTIQGGASIAKNLIVGDGLYVINGNIGLGVETAQSKLDVNGSITLRGETSEFNPNNEVDLINRQQTYIAFGANGSENDWAYLRQTGGVDNMMLTLDFHNGATDAGFQIRDINSSLNPDAAPTTRFMVAKGGNVGIATNNPVQTLHVSGRGYFGSPTFTTWASGVSMATIAGGARLVANSDVTEWPASSGSTASTGNAFRIRGADDAVCDMGVYSANGLWIQSTNANNYSATYPILLNPNGGNIGIGITNPTSLLHVFRNVNSEVTFRIVNANNNSSASTAIRINNDTNDNAYFFLNSSTRSNDGGANSATLRNDAGDLRLQSKGNNGVIIKSTTSNVGIKTDNPIYALDVNGNARIQSELIVTNTNESLTPTTASLSLLGGLSVNKNVNLYDNRESLNSSTGSLVSYGGISIASTVDSSSLTQGGAMTVRGGVSIEKTTRTNRLLISSTESALNNTTGSLITSGGIVIQNNTDAINILNGGSFLTRGGASIGGKTFHGSDVYMHKSMIFWQNDETELIKMFDNTNSIQKWSIGKSAFPEDSFFIQRHNTLTGQSVEKVIEISTDGKCKFNNTLASSNKDNASVILSGGLSIKNETDAVSVSQGGALTIAGGLSVAKNTYLAGLVKNVNETQSISTASGALVVTGGVGIGGNINIGGNAVVTGNLTVLGSSTTVNTSNVTIKDNIFLLNSGPSGTSDSGLLIQRYQVSNNNYEGDVVNDLIPVYKDVLVPLQSFIQNNQIKFPEDLRALTDDYYVGWWIKINYPSLANGQVRQIIEYNATLNIATLDQVWTGVAPANGETFNLYNRSYVGLIFDETNNIFAFSSVPKFNDERGSLNNVSDMPLRMSFGLITDKTVSNSSSGCLNLMGGMTILNTVDSVSITSGGALTINGGASIAKKLHVGQELIVNGVAITPSTGDIQREQLFVSTASSGSIVGLGFSSNITRSFDIFCSVIVNAASSLYANFHLRGINKETSWEIASSYVGDETGVVFYIDAFGQVQFTRSSYIGFVDVTFKFKAITIGV